MTPAARIQGALERSVARIPKQKNLADMMSGVQPVDELIRPVRHDNAKAFAIMAVPDQIAAGFLCRGGGRPVQNSGLTAGGCQVRSLLSFGSPSGL